MTLSMKKLATLLACTAALGTVGVAQAAPQHGYRSAAPHSQRHVKTPARRHVRPAPRSTHVYRRGSRLPRAWRSPSRTVTNWRAHRNLHQPPRGYQWVRGDNNEMLLVAIATGVIASVVTNAMAY